MRRRGSVWTVGWILLGLLILSTSLLLLGTRERMSKPSALSYAPSGTHALVELLRREGYEVAIDRSSKPRLAPTDLALGFIVPVGRGPFGVPEPMRPTPTHKSLASHVAEGGRALVCLVPENFQEATKKATGRSDSVAFASSSDQLQEFRISPADGLSTEIESLPFDIASPPYDIAWNRDDISACSIYTHGKGFMGLTGAGLVGTNRFLDLEENAGFVIRLVRTFLPESGRIVILDALNSNPVDPSLLGSIGNWALAAWWQLILVFIVIAYSLGKRFGVPEQIRYEQRGGRELADAYADVMHRARMPHVALAKIALEADREVRRRFAVSADLSPSRRNEVLPQGLAQALTRAEVASHHPLPEGAAVDLAEQLEAEMAKLRGEPMRRKRKKR